MCHWRLALWFQKLKPGPVSLSNCCPWIEIALSYFSSTTSACMTPCLLTWWQQTRPLNCKPAPGKCFLLLRVAVAMVSLPGNRTLTKILSNFCWDRIFYWIWSLPNLARLLGQWVAGLQSSGLCLPVLGLYSVPSCPISTFYVMLGLWTHPQLWLKSLSESLNLVMPHCSRRMREHR